MSVKDCRESEPLPNLDSPLGFETITSSRGCNAVLGSSLLHCQVLVKIFLAFPGQIKLKGGILVRPELLLLLLPPQTHWLQMTVCCGCWLGCLTQGAQQDGGWGEAGVGGLLCLFFRKVCVLVNGRGTLLHCFSNSGRSDPVCFR